MRNSWWGVLFLVVIGGLIYLLDAVLMPFIAGMILAYLADPLTNQFQRWGMNRPLAVSSVFLVLLIVLVVSLLILIPLLVQQLKQLGEAIPGIFNWVENTLAPQVQEWTGYDLSIELTNARETLVENWRCWRLLSPGVRTNWPFRHGFCILDHLRGADTRRHLLFVVGLESSAR